MSSEKKDIIYKLELNTNLGVLKDLIEKCEDYMYSEEGEFDIDNVRRWKVKLKKDKEKKCYVIDEEWLYGKD